MAISPFTVPRLAAEDTQPRIVRFLDQKVRTRIPKKIQHPKIKTTGNMFRFVLTILWCEAVELIIKILRFKVSTFTLEALAST